MELLEDWLESQGEQQRAERIALLNSSLRADPVVAKEEFRGGGVAPLGERGQAWEVIPALFEKRLPGHGVESVFEVDFQEHRVGAAGVAFAPLPCDMHSDLCPARLPDTYLEGPEVGGGLVLESSA